MTDTSAARPVARADAGERYAAGRLVDLLAERGDLDGLLSQSTRATSLPPTGSVVAVTVSGGDLILVIRGPG